MTSLIRDVLFPSAAALGLLAAAITDPAVADESYYDDDPAAIIAAAPIAVVTASSAVTAQVAPTVAARSTVATGARAEGNKGNGIETRCERTGRIGKFKITRCD